MKYTVNDGCIGCGLCEGTCPEVFSMTGENVAKAISMIWRRAILTAVSHRERHLSYCLMTGAARYVA